MFSHEPDASAGTLPLKDWQQVVLWLCVQVAWDIVLCCGQLLPLEQPPTAEGASTSLGHRVRLSDQGLVVGKDRLPRFGIQGKKSHRPSNKSSTSGICGRHLGHGIKATSISDGVSLTPCGEKGSFLRLIDDSMVATKPHGQHNSLAGRWC